MFKKTTANGDSMNGYIIEAYNNMGNAYTCRRLVDEAGKRGITLDIVGIHDTVIMEDGMYNHGQKLEKRDFVINRYKWGRMKDSINALCDFSYPDLSVFNDFINKYVQLCEIHSDAFLKPKYVMANSSVGYEWLKSTLGERIVAKGLEKSMGREIFLIENADDFAKLLEYGVEKEWLFEEFIDTSYGKDVRVYCIRGEVVACMKRQSEDDFRANVALGGSVTAFPVSEDIKQIAKDVYYCTGLDYVGIDLLFGKEKFYFCEINVMPGLEGIEAATGVNVAEKMIAMICGDVEA